jgi:hypothetical protein
MPTRKRGRINSDGAHDRNAQHHDADDLHNKGNNGAPKRRQWEIDSSFELRAKAAPQPAPTRLTSISVTQVPEVTVEVRAASGLQLYLFDPKYKLDSDQSDGITAWPKKDDIDKMLAYRDALRGRRTSASFVMRQSCIPAPV